MSTRTQGIRSADQRPRRGLVSWCVAVVTVLAVAVLGGAPAHAAFEVTDFEAGAFTESGVAETRAGAHPYSAKTTFTTSLNPDNTLDGRMRDVRIKLPAGFSGNPLATGRCSRAQFAAVIGDNGVDGDLRPWQACPPDSQVGVAYARIVQPSGPLVPAQQAVWNLVPPPGAVAQVGFVVMTVPVTITISLDPADGYRLVATSESTSIGLPVVGADVELWGVPNHPRHDADRYCGRAYGGQAWFAPPCPVDAPSTPFLTNPTHCRGPETALVEIDSWQAPDVWATRAYDAPALSGCDQLLFEPSMVTRPSSKAAGMPTGLSVDLDLRTDDDPVTGLAPAHLKDVSVSLPEGMAVNPSSAHGLEACADARIGFGDDAPANCPGASKVGTVRAETPVLEEALDGAVYVRTQASDDPASGEMVRLAMVLESAQRGIRVKLPGRVHLDPETGRVTARFADNPEVPVSRIEFAVKEGQRAPLVAPSNCGRQAVDANLTSWAGHDVDLAPGFDVDCGPGVGGFAPAFAAGSTSPVAGSPSPFVLSVDKPDGNSDLDRVQVEMPKGLLATLRGNVGQRVGTAHVAAGPGPSPYWLSGPVVLEGPYGDAPFSLRVTVPAKAGPFDLGDVVVRQKIHVDPETAEVRVVSDPLPKIVKGIPVKLQTLRVEIDKPGFTLNPTSCAVQRVGGTLGASASGQTARLASRFQVGECRSLGFSPRLAMRLTGKRQTKTGRHPGLRTVLTQPAGQANIGRAQVTLPRSVVLDAENAYDPKLVCDYDVAQKADCPASSVIGSAKAVTPLLARPLTGKVHLVQGIRFSRLGNRIRTTPSLLVKLRGEVAINLRGRTTVRNGTLVTIFDSVPDARVSRFQLDIKGGSKGILVVTANRRGGIDLCRGRHVARLAFNGHNGKQANFRTAVKTPCGKAKRAKKRAAKR